MTGQADATERLAGLVRQALESADLDSYASLLDPDVRWGPPGDPAPPCQSRAQVLAWYKRGRESGTRATVTETLVSGDKILVGLTVTSPPADAGAADAAPADAGADDAEADDAPAADEVNRWQVLTVRDGRVADITGFDDRDEAAAWAGLASR